MKNKAIIIMALALLCLVSGCTDGQETSENKKQETMVENGDVQSETEKTLPKMEEQEEKIETSETAMAENEDVQSETEKTPPKMEEQEEKIETSETAMAEMNGENTATPQLLSFVDIHKKEYQAEMNVNVEKHPYIIEGFQLNGEKMTYVGDANYSYRLGVDVSHYQGSIDWNKVKAAGLDVGVYFFAQAINEEEALEEAQFVIANLAGETLQLPIVYDPETIEDAQARTDNVSGEQFTKNTITFCNAVKAAGYEPMVYSNMLWEAFVLDLEQLAEYPIWYADYEPLPQTPYRFTFWQYTNKGRVDGIPGNVDLNIQLIPVGNT